MGSIFAGIKEAKMSFDSSYIRPGHIIARIERVRADQSRKKEDFVAIEMTVLHVLDPYEDQLPENSVPERAGESVSHLLMARSDYFLSDMKAFLAHTLDVLPDEVTEEDCVKVTSESNPMGGMLVEVKARSRITKENKTFTVVNYVREVALSDLMRMIPAEQVLRFYDQKQIDAILATEQAA